MEFVLGLPTDQAEKQAEFLTADAVAEVAQRRGARPASMRWG